MTNAGSTSNVTTSVYCSSEMRAGWMQAAVLLSLLRQSTVLHSLLRQQEQELSPSKRRAKEAKRAKEARPKRQAGRQ